MKKHIDTVGKLCPIPLMEAKRVMEELQSGDEVVIDYDCSQATENLPRWAAEVGHEVTNFEQIGDAQWTITIKKG